MADMALEGKGRQKGESNANKVIHFTAKVSRQQPFKCVNLY